MTRPALRRSSGLLALACAAALTAIVATLALRPSRPPIPVVEVDQAELRLQNGRLCANGGATPFSGLMQHPGLFTAHFHALG